MMSLHDVSTWFQAKRRGIYKQRLSTLINRLSTLINPLHTASETFKTSRESYFYVKRDVWKRRIKEMYNIKASFLLSFHICDMTHSYVWHVFSWALPCGVWSARENVPKERKKWKMKRLYLQKWKETVFSGNNVSTVFYKCFIKSL